MQINVSREAPIGFMMGSSKLNNIPVASNKLNSMDLSTEDMPCDRWVNFSTNHGGVLVLNSINPLALARNNSSTIRIMAIWGQFDLMESMNDCREGQAIIHLLSYVL